jgi:tRNA(Ile)-lysidine synthase
MPRDATPAQVKSMSEARTSSTVPRAADAPLRAAARVLPGLVPPGARLCVGLSGGADSVVLLDVLLALAPAYRWRISALHVNHQLSVHAPAWVRFCRRLCRERGVPLRVVKVTVPPGDSTEAAARAARYAAYRAQPAPYIVLAQHQDDQAETVLLQLLRGAGVKGLAAMAPARADSARAGFTVLRPLLGVTRREIEAHATARALPWVDDDSNSDTHYLRNFLRLDILPRVAARVPGYRAILARAAGQMAEAAQLLDALAQHDGAGALVDGTLAVSALTALPPARARNLLRHFIAVRGARMPDARRLDEALRQALTAKSDARVCVNLGDHDLRRHRGALQVVTRRALAPDAGAKAQPWHGERLLELPQWHGALEMRRRRGAGIDLEALLAQPVSLRLRRGGEKLRVDAARPRRALKDWFQAAGVPPWRRDRLPCLWSGERLVWVAGLGIDCAFQAGAGTAAVVPRWIERTGDHP